MAFKIALLGNPNCGKTTLFNNLTGASQYVGNWPGVTVEKKEGFLKGNRKVKIVDLPGIYSLMPYTDEEIVSRNFLFLEKPDLILNVVSAVNLERSLYLTLQLLELNIPVVVAVSMVDKIEKDGGFVNFKELSKRLNCGVVKVLPMDYKSGIFAVDFALDFLNCYIKYKSHKDKKTFESDIISKISSFKNYKLIGSLFSEVKDSDEKIIATISYITKDPTFFHGTYELMTPPENIQTASFILEIKKYIEHKRALLNLEKCIKMVQLYSDKLQKTEILNQDLITEKTNLRKENEKFLSRLNQLESEYKNLKNDNNIMKTNINNLTNENNSMKTNINTMETKINNLTNENNTMKTNINNLQTDNNILQAKVNSLENENEKLKQNEIVTQSNIQNIIENNNSLSQKVEDMTKRLEKIDLRDTIKMSFRYLYKVLKSNFPN